MTTGADPVQELRRLAEAAKAESDGDWFDPDLIESTAKISATVIARRFIAACSPDRILRLLEVAEKARKALDHMATVQEIARQWEPDDSSGKDRRWLVLARDDERALRASLNGLDKQ